MNHHDSNIGIGFTNVKLQITEISTAQNQFKVSRIDEVYFNEEIDFAKDKETKITSLLQAAFEEVSIKNSITSNSASFSLPQELFVTARLPFEESLLHSDLLEEFRWNLSIMYPYLNWNDYVINYHEVDGKYFASGDIALVFALNRKYIKIINDFCSRNNLKLKIIDHCHLSSSNILNMNILDNTNNCFSVYIAQKMLSVLVSVEGKIIYYEDIPISSIQEVRILIKDKLNELNQKQLNFTEAFLFGDTTSGIIAKALTEATGISFNLVNPFSQLKVETNLMTDKYYTETNHFFSPSTGVAARI
jgi:Tfp pilus assembly PilM family ATPase